jgi:hypothetical protein
MDREEFITLCSTSGYSSVKTATEYAKDKDVLSENDIIEVYRINERKIYLKNKINDPKFRDYMGVKTTKRLKTKQSDENTEF